MEKRDFAEEKFVSRRILEHFIMFFGVTIIIAFCEYLLIIPIKNTAVKVLMSVLCALLDLAALTFVINRTMKLVKSKLKVFVDKNTYYESILDAVPFPIHVTNKDMKWTYMNKSFEDMLTKSGTIKDRSSAYGLACSTASANICNTESCGIRQLREKGKAETYFDWFDLKCKQDTSAIKDVFGNVIGYVEVVSDLTSILKVNEYANAEIKRLSAVLERIADGNLDAKLEITPPDQYTEEMSTSFRKINDSISKVMDSIHIMGDEVEKLVQAGTEGKLEVRGETEKLSGIFAYIVNGVNQTFDSIKAPLDVASDFIQNLADGVPQENIENHYKGYYARLADNLNHARESLQTLVNESLRLADAGINGRLDTRGDASALSGTYAKIIEGINQTLDAVVIPLKESLNVLQKFAYNDYTEKMSGEYQGSFVDFAESINLVHTRLMSTQDALIKLGEGDVSRLQEFKKIGKRSENDKIMPAVANAFQTIQNLIDESKHLALAAYEGNLEVRGDVELFTGGYRQIIEGMNKTMEAVDAPIQESSKVLQELAQGNLTVAMTGQYSGSYDLMKTGINQAIDAFSDLLSEITVAAEQVAVGSQQVSNGSQMLSQGATEQASSVEQLTSSVSEISTQTKQNAKSATNASTLAVATQAEATQGKEKMGQMLGSMQEINESSANISKINKVIDDIAFQTNILALNAAVEAARAGQYGKGFAVVAEEVRNLAAKSAEAARETTALIESSIDKVQHGTKIASDTAGALTKISDSIQQVTELVSDIATSSNQQATAIFQIDQGLSQVSSVIQSNSSAAEESAASSEELSGQADMLKQMVRKFKIKNAGYSEHPNQREDSDYKNHRENRQKKITLAESSINNSFGKY